MPEEPVFKVSDKMFQMLSDWQEKIADGTIPDPTAESETTTKPTSSEESLGKSTSSEEKQGFGDQTDP